MGNMPISVMNRISCDITPSEKKKKFQTCDKLRITFLGYENELVPWGDMQFLVFKKKGHKLNYAGKVITHTLVTLHKISSGVLYRLAKITSHKPFFHFKRVDNVYPSHVNSFWKIGLAPTIYRKWYIYRKVKMKNRYQDVKRTWSKKK